MPKLYSRSTGCCYDRKIHSVIPNDVIEISDETFYEVIARHVEGKVRSHDSKGYPILVDAPPPTDQQLRKQYEVAIQNHMDSTAQSAGYDDIYTVVTYAEEPSVIKFQNDGKAFRKWRSLVWAYAYEQLDLVLSGERSIPTIDEFILELPQLDNLV